MKNIIEINNLVVKYSDFVAVNDISFNVKEGELLALLGKNGAGKSTTINVLCTLKQKAQGKVIINGYDLDSEANKIKDSIGIVFQSSVLDGFLTVEENIKTRASLYGMKKNDYQARLNYLVDMLELKDILKKRYSQLSGGQKRKVDIARALINNPKILFLDEPTTGLDPQTRIKVWKTLNEIRLKDKTTIILTTHYMEETKNADSVVIINKGRVMEQGTPAYLKDKYAYDSLRLYYKQDKLEQLISILSDYHINNEVDYLELRINKDVEVMPLLNSISELINSFELQKGDMDIVFLNVIGDKMTIGDVSHE